MENEKLNIEKNLADISKIAAPPFLYTRIEAKIEDQIIPAGLTFASLSLAISCLVIGFNIWFLIGSSSPVELKADSESNTETYDMISSLNESNQIYYD